MEGKEAFIQYIKCSLGADRVDKTFFFIYLLGIIDYEMDHSL